MHAYCMGWQGRESEGYIVYIIFVAMWDRIIYVSLYTSIQSGGVWCSDRLQYTDTGCG